MKKTVLPLLILCVCIICSCFAIAANAETECVIRGEKVVSEPNSDVTMNIFIENNPGIGGAELIVAYHEKLTLVKAESGAAFSALSYTLPSQFKSPMVFAWDSLEIADKDIKDGVILTLTFHIAEDATGDLPVNISYESGNIFDKDLKVIDPAVESGCVTAISYLPGDADDNKRINTLDVTKIRRFIVDGRKTDPEGYNVVINLNAADVDSSANINTLDITLIRRYIADGKITDPNGYNVVLKPGKLACNHNMVHTEGKDATCTENGNIEYWQCTSCEKYYADAEGKYEILLSNTVIAAGHTFAEEWSYDETSHWLDATCEHKDLLLNAEEHTFVNHVCSVCNADEMVRVTFEDAEGAVIDEQMVAYGADAIAPEPPVLTGYVFDGWDGTFTAVAEDVTITATYAPAYTVTFLDYDGTVLKTQAVKEGGSATAYEFTNENVIPEGFARTGWDTAFDKVEQNLTVTATYVKKTYTVGFYMPDNTLIAQQTVEHGEDAEEPECAETYFDWSTLKMGSFSGWSESLKDIKGEKTIYAQFKNEHNQPVISISTTKNSASIKMYAPANCYLYAIDFGFEWSGNVSIVSCDKNIASNLYKGNDGASNIDFSNKYNTFHYTWTNAAGVKLEGAYTTVLDIQFVTDGDQTVNPDILELLEECTVIFSNKQTSDMDELKTVTPIVVMK
jgi:hypothetical protein